MSKARAVYEFNNFDLIIRCVEDIIAPFSEGVLETYVRNVQIAYSILYGYIKIDNPDIVLIVNAADLTPAIHSEDGSCNGSIYIGRKYFMFDAKKYDTTSISNLKPDIYNTSSVNSSIFEMFNENEKKEIA